MKLRARLRSYRESLNSRGEWLMNHVAPPLVVLIYHRVMELDEDPQMLAVHPDRFRQHLRALKESFEIIRFEQDNRRITEPSVIITFDDGYADNFLYALPILDEMKIPATFFIATGYVGGDREFWWDELERVLLQSEGGPIVRRVGAVELDKSFDCSTFAGRRAFYQYLHPRVKRLAISARESLLSELERLMIGTPPSRHSHRALSIPELVHMAQSEQVTIGAHTVWHQPLSSLCVEEQHHEIHRSKVQLEAWIGRSVDVFSYPFGARSDYSQDAVGLCEREGFCKVAANHAGVVRPWTDPFRVPRFLVRDWSAEELINRLRRFAGMPPMV